MLYRQNSRFGISKNKKYSLLIKDFNHKRKVFTFTPEKEENTNLETNNLTNQIEEDFGSLITVE